MLHRRRTGREPLRRPCLQRNEWVYPVFVFFAELLFFMSACWNTCLADYANPCHARALVDLLNEYASEPAGGAQPLTEEVRHQLVPALAQRLHAFSVLAWDMDRQDADGGPLAVGLVNCLEGFSTFLARPLVNIHDVAVRANYRQRGVAQAMFAAVEAEARRRGACKLTLEVLNGNRPAWRMYEAQGFAPYALDPAWGEAVMMQKKL